jgi:hypothetical protein
MRKASVDTESGGYEIRDNEHSANKSLARFPANPFFPVKFFLHIKIEQGNSQSVVLNTVRINLSNDDLSFTYDGE